MRTEEINIYNYEDLLKNESLKEKVLSQFQPFTEHLYQEIHESLNKFNEVAKELEPHNENMTGLRLRTWIINNFYPSIESGKYLNTLDGKKTHKMSGEIFEGQNGFHTHIRSNIQIEISCPFTGVCWDHNLLDPIIEFVESPNNQSTWNSLILKSIESIEKALQDEIDYRHTDEAKIEDIEANQYEFTSDGKRY